MPEIPDFEILRRIGGGSYGEVFLGRSITGALRAVKIVRREDFELERTFEREFEGIKQYEKVSRGHTGLVDVFHVSRNDKEGFYYYVMELADDCDAGAEGYDVENYEPRTLSWELKRCRQHTIAECVSIGYRLSEALGHLHYAGLTHRDVKPSNIIFINGEPQLADIGLVARTGQRTFVGTEGYVPPEGPGTSSSDLYSLAMVLYEMATGKDRLEFPELPTNMELPPTMNRDEWRSLNSVICRGGAPDPRRRFDTGQKFATALQGVLSTEDKPSSGLGKVAVLTTALLGLVAMGAAFAWKQFEPDADPENNIDLVDNGTGASGGGSETDDPDQSTPTTGDGGDSDTSTMFVENFGDTKNPFVFPFPGTGTPSPFNSDPTKGVVFSDPETTPPSSIKPEVEDTAPEAPPKPEEKPVATYKLFSNPAGATVWHEGQIISRTPTSFLTFEPGEVELVLKSDGFHDLIVKRELREGRQTELELEMLPDLRPRPPSNWKNSLEMVFKFEPELGIFISETEVGPEAVSQFNRDTGRPEATASQAGAAYVPNDDEMMAFCDWLTDRDQKRGYLGDDQYHSPQRSGTSGESATFFSKIDDRFGALFIDSDPQGADIFSNGKVIGQTPQLLTSRRVGRMTYELGKPGFERTKIVGEINANAQSEVKATLKRDASVVFDRPWVNGLGMKFVPFENLMASIFETRVSDYEAFLASKPEGITQPRVGYDQENNHPVAGVSADDGRAFCKWLTEKDRAAGLIQPYHEYRLPTDLEWSAMAGIPDEGGTSPDNRDTKVLGIYPWGKKWPPPVDSGNFGDESAKEMLPKSIEGYNDGFPNTAPVGSFIARENGLHDLAGNVWEWVDEVFRPGSKNMTARGGGWGDSEKDNFLVSYRNAVPPGIVKNNAYGYNVFGFRCVLAKKAE